MPELKNYITEEKIKLRETTKEQLYAIICGMELAYRLQKNYENIEKLTLEDIRIFKIWKEENAKKKRRKVAHFDKSLSDNKPYVLSALREEGANLCAVSERLKADEDVVLEALKENKRAIVFASPKLKYNPEFLKKLDKEIINYI